MASSSSGSSSSFSSSFIPDYPQAPFLMQLAQMEQNYGQQQYNWAQNQFANTSALTDQAVSNYLNASNSAMKLANNNYDRYTQIFQPMENQLVSDANTYASTPRINLEMGQAESGVGQAMDRGRINAEQQLQSYGIDPSSGRYAELESAQNAQKAAAQAGAGNVARQNTEQTGRNLRAQAIQVGQQYPGQMVNALNSETQALSGAVNAKLANLNTGVNAFNSANQWFNSANQLRYPPLGNSSRSQSQQSGQSTDPSRSGGGGGGSGGGGNGGGAGGGYGGGTNGGAYAGYGGVGGIPNAGIMNTGGGSGYDWGSGGSMDPSNTWSWDGGGNSGYDPSADPYSGGTNYNPYSWDGGVGANGSSGGNWYSPGAMDSGQGNTWGDGSSAYDPSSYTGASADWGSGGGGGGSSWGGSDGSYSGGSADWSGGGGGSSDNYGFTSGDSYSFAGGGAVPFNWQSYGYNFNGYPGGGGGGAGGSPAGVASTPTNPNTPTPVAANPNAEANASGYQDWNMPNGMTSSQLGKAMLGTNYSAGTESAGGGWGGGVQSSGSGQSPWGMIMAEGGAIPQPSTGGHVPYSASPSMGQQTDDIPANLNAGEFVIPRDVAAWEGQKSLQGIITKARAAMAEAAQTGARGKTGPRAPGPVRFQSQGMGRVA